VVLSISPDSPASITASSTEDPQSATNSSYDSGNGSTLITDALVAGRGEFTITELTGQFPDNLSLLDLRTASLAARRMGWHQIDTGWTTDQRGCFIDVAVELHNKVNEGIISEDLFSLQMNELRASIEKEQPVADNAYLQSVWLAAEKQIHSLYSFVNNTGTLTIAPLPKYLITPDLSNDASASKHITADSNVKNTVLGLYEDTAATSFRKNSRSSANQVHITFKWQPSGNHGITVTVTYRGPLKQVVNLYTAGLLTETDLENAGIAEHIQKHIQRDSPNESQTRCTPEYVDRSTHYCQNAGLLHQK
jgi:hypothetical protein